MSIAADIETGALEDLDFAIAKRCESVKHLIDPDVHADGGEHYVHFVCPSCAYDSGATIRCGLFVQRLIVHPMFWMACPECHDSFYAPDVVTILGPVEAV